MKINLYQGQKNFKGGLLANHTYVRKLEKKLQELFNVKHCLLSTSGTSALELIFRSLKIKIKKF